jgi:hypothetical protein
MAQYRGIESLEMWTIYFNPADHPGQFVTRRCWIGPGTITPDPVRFRVGKTLEEARTFVPWGCERLDRDPADEPQIVEVWI